MDINKNKMMLYICTSKTLQIKMYTFSISSPSNLIQLSILNYYSQLNCTTTYTLPLTPLS